MRPAIPGHQESYLAEAGQQAVRNPNLVSVRALGLAFWLGTTRPRALRSLLVAYGLAVTAACAVVLAAV